VSRTRRALVSSGFAYLQYAVSIVISIIVVPLVLARVDIRAYGLWLAAADLLAYVALLDLGVFGVLPWLIAEADGRRDEPTIRRALSNAMAAAGAISAVYALAVVAAWAGFPGLLGLTAADRAAIAGPLLIVAVAAMASMPLSVCQAALAGMQDVTFSGAAALVRIVLNAALTIGLLLQGYGLYAVAIGSTVPAIVAGVASVFRLRTRYATLARGWPRPSLDGVRWLITTAVGAWLGAFGWKLLSMSSGLVLTAVGHPELVPLYSCTARLSTVAVQMGWIIPDSGLIGLAQLLGEGRLQRLREVTRTLLQLHLVIAGAAATLLLAVNPAFVSWWVSPALFGGHRLNVLLAAGVVIGSVAHALMTVPSVLGRRLEVGWTTIAHGVVHVGLAYALASVIGFAGIAVASILAAAITAIPAGLRITAERTGMSVGEMVETVTAWGVRAWPAAGLALACGLVSPVGGVWTAAALWVPIGGLYVWLTRPLYRDVPLDPRLRSALARVRLMPAIEPAAARPELTV
jgi:O-antigen/teichoic acid export membrane protein